MSYSDLIARGATRAVVHFSGGNDEGGAERIDLLDADGKSIGQLDEWRGTEADRELAEKLAQPIYDRYGSFAGDFSVYGTLTWDVATRTCKLEKEESSYQHGEEYL